MLRTHKRDYSARDKVSTGVQVVRISHEENLALFKKSAAEFCWYVIAPLKMHFGTFMAASD